jgi:tetratricopeptide (TPR) repeat protein
MRAMVLSENWDAILDGQSLPVYDRPRELAWRHWAMGVAQASKGDAQAATQEMHQMDAALKQYEQEVKRKPPAELVVGRQELEGHILAAQGKADAAFHALESAALAQRKLRYSEPPYYPRPVDEAIGEVSLRLGRFQDAEVAFRRCLVDLPGSARSIAGLQETLRRENKTSGAAGLQ